MLFNQIAIAQTYEESFEQSFDTNITQADILNDKVEEINVNYNEDLDDQKISLANSTIDFQINENQLLHKVLEKAPKEEKTLLLKFLGINDNQIKGFYSYKEQTFKVESKSENFSKILKYLESKNLTFQESNCPMIEDENCLLTSEQDFEGYKVSFDDQAIYIHKKALSDDLLTKTINIPEDIMIKANIEFENNPFEIKLTNKDSNFGISYSTLLQDKELIEAINQKNTKLNYKNYISPQTLFFFENKGLEEKYNLKIEKILNNMFKEVCYVTNIDCNEINVIEQNDFQEILKDTKIYELITQNNSGIIVNVNENLDLNYNLIFDNSNNIKEDLIKDLEYLLQNYEYTKNQDTYEINTSFQEIKSDFNGSENIDSIQVDKFSDETSIPQIIVLPSETVTQKTYIKITEKENHIFLNLSNQENIELEKNDTQNKEENLLGHFMVNPNAYLDILLESENSYQSILNAFAGILKDITISSDTYIKDNKLTTNLNIYIPEETLETGIEMIPNQIDTFEDSMYDDIKKDDWYYESFTQLDKEISLGYILDQEIDFTTFKQNIEPSKEISRKEFIMLITELLFQDEIFELETQHQNQLKNQAQNMETYSYIREQDMFSDFQDPKIKGFYHIQVAKNNGLVKGDAGKNTLRPNDSLSRAEAITLLARSFESLKNTEAEELELNFQDVPKDAWYLSNLKKAVKNKVVKGTTPTTFSPTDKLNRAQAVTLINRLNNQILKFF